MSHENDVSTVARIQQPNFQRRDATPEVDERRARLREAVKMAGGNAKVSSKSGVPLSTLNGYLTGYDIKASNLVALADACGVHIAWLAAGRGPMAVDPSPMEKVQQANDAALEALNGPQPPRKPAPDRVFSAFVTMDHELLGTAIGEALAKYSEAGRQPNSTQLAAVALALYDNMSGQLTKP